MRVSANDAGNAESAERNADISTESLAAIALKILPTARKSRCMSERPFAGAYRTLARSELGRELGGARQRAFVASHRVLRDSRAPQLFVV